MKRPDLVLWRDVINELAHGLQIAIGFSAQIRRHTRMTADEAEQLEAAIGRAVNALRRLQPATASPTPARPNDAPSTDRAVS